MNEDFDIRQEMVSPAEKEFEKALRPLKFSDFSGQNGVVENLEVFVEAAKYRGEPLDHTLLHGPPGLGKTTLSNIIANELGVGLRFHRVLCLISRAIWRESLPRWSPTMCSLSMKSTDFRLW